MFPFAYTSYLHAKEAGWPTASKEKLRGTANGRVGKFVQFGITYIQSAQTILVVDVIATWKTFPGLFKPGVRLPSVSLFLRGGVGSYKWF